MAEPFAIFTSYSIADGKIHGGVPFKKFYTLLDELVANKVSTVRPNICFIDRTYIKVGEEWKPELTHGVRTAEVLICLISPRYLDSKWCGRELEVFVRRIQQWKALSDNSGKQTRFIFPIWWEKPRDRESLPKGLQPYNPSDPGFPAVYLEKGIRQLLALNKKTAIQTFADVLSDRICEALDGSPPLGPADEIADFGTFPSAFEMDAPPSPYQVAALATTAAGFAWKASENSPNLLQMLEIAAGKSGVAIRPLDIAAGVAPALDKAQKDLQLTLLLADAAADPADAILNAINGFPMNNLAIIVIYTGAGNAGSVTSESWIQRFPDGSLNDAAKAGRITLTGTRDLEAAIEGLITRARQQLIQRDDFARATDLTLSADAVAAGIPVLLKPNLDGPTALNP